MSSSVLLTLMMLMVVMMMVVNGGEMIPITEETQVMTLKRHKVSIDGFVDVLVDKKVKRMMVNSTYIRYSVPLQLHTDRPLANMIIDTQSALVYAYCCDSPVVNNQTTSACISSSSCQLVECDKDCQSKIFEDKQYVPIVKNLQSLHSRIERKDPDVLYDKQPYLLQVYRQESDDFYPSIVGFHAANSSHAVSNDTDLLVYTVYANSPYYEGTDGVLGMAFSSFDFSFQSYLTANFAKNDRIFALDFFNKDEEDIMLTFDGQEETEVLSGDGRLVMGPAVYKYMKKYAYRFIQSQLVWSERQFTINSLVEKKYAMESSRFLTPIQHIFPIYDMSICGNSLFSNYSGNWHAIVSTDIVGLGLPSQFYRMVVQWLQKANTTKSFSDWSVLERLTLPDLTFRLHMSDDNEDTMLRIPLSALFEDDELHIYDSGEAFVIDGLGVLSSEPYIQFGVKVLQQLFTVLDYSNYRVGFLQKKRDANHEHLQNMYCESTDKRETCIGDQQYYAPMNTCLQPQCELYMFQTVDESSGKCRLGASFYALFILLIGMCLISEVVLYELYHRVIQSLYSRAAANNAALNGSA